MTTARFIFFLFFFAIGIAVLYFGQRARRQADAVKRWPAVQGSLLDCQLVSESDVDSTALFHHVTVLYSYVVQGREYRSARYAFAYAATRDKEEHQRIYEQLKNGKTLRVHYDPQNPAESALSAKKENSIFLFGLIWTGFVALVFLGVLLGG